MPSFFCLCAETLDAADRRSFCDLMEEGERRITGRRMPGGNHGSAGREVNWKRGAFAN